MDKEEFHWLFGVVQGWFSAKLGSKISDGSQLAAQFYLGHQQPQGHNKQESTTFILPYGQGENIRKILGTILENYNFQK
jgi:hypothetical protein